MSKVKILGIVEQKGEYQGRPYHNLVLHTVQPSNSLLAVGDLTECVKIKYSVLNELLKLGLDLPQVEALKPSDFGYMIGSDANIFYNRFGVVDALEILPKQSVEKSNNTVHGGGGSGNPYRKN